MARTRAHGALVACEQLRDRAFAAEWEATVVARVVAARLIDYRSEHGLSQRQLAERLGVKQPYVARLESGERNPELETLVRLSRALGIEFMLDIAPPERLPRLIGRKIREEHASADRDGVSVTFAAR
jgi:transcriptional regulator with XRE-family HTH domain